MDSLSITNIAINKLKPYIANPRKNDDVVDRMADSIKEFGFRIPVLAKSDGTVIDGHLRIKAAIKLGIKEIPVIVSDDMTEAQIKAFRLMVNQSVAWAEWDEELLRKELEALKVMDYNLEMTGFDMSYIESLLGNNIIPEGNTDPDEVPEVPEEPISKPGDIWLLGNHRLMCGDSTVVTDVERLMNGKKAVLFATDPPYGVAYGDETGNGNKFGKIKNDENDGGKLQNFLESVFKTYLPFLEKNSAWYLWHAQMTQGFFAAAAAAAAVIIHRQIVWVKPSLIMGHGDFHWKHELCFYGWVQGNRPSWYGDRCQTTVWEIGRENDHIHPTQKPTEIFTRPMNYNTKINEICAEPFSGSGSQLIAAEQTNRICYAMEIDPHYVDVAVKRWENFTGKKAELENL